MLKKDVEAFDRLYHIINNKSLLEVKTFFHHGSLMSDLKKYRHDKEKKEKKEKIKINRKEGAKKNKWLVFVKKYKEKNPQETHKKALVSCSTILKDYKIKNPGDKRAIDICINDL